MLKIALVYDFDGTLAKGNLPEYGLLPDLNIKSHDFWKEVKENTRENDADEILVYMQLLLKKAKDQNLPLTKACFEKHAKKIPFFDGVSTWFSRINEFARDKNIEIDHFIISSGIFEMIKASKIAKNFKFIFASKYLYNSEMEADSIAVAINYTTKTQFLFRINKGIFNYYDNQKINTWVQMDKREYPFEKMIYLGDGDTDIPAMKMTRTQGGYSIAVFDPEKWNDPSSQNKIYKLIAEDRAQYVAPADYSDGSQLDIVVKGIIGKIHNEFT